MKIPTFKTNKELKDFIANVCETHSKSKRKKGDDGLFVVAGCLVDRDISLMISTEGISPKGCLSIIKKVKEHLLIKFGKNAPDETVRLAAELAEKLQEAGANSLGDGDCFCGKCHKD